MDNADTIIVKSSDREKRKKRVTRLKTGIVAVITSLLLIPLICCVLLFVKMDRMQRQLDSLMDMHSQFREELSYNTGIVRAAEAGNQERDSPETAAGDQPVMADAASDTDNAIEDDHMDEKNDTPYTDDLIEGKKAYLTFDDGPSSHVNQILDILKKYNVRATFFVIGKTDENSKAAYKRITDEGHTLAMHSFSHKYDQIYSSVMDFKEDYQSLSDLLYETTGTKPDFYRFPGGSSNTVSKVDMKKLVSFLNESGITYFDWNVTNGDAAGQNITVKEMIKTVENGVKRFSSSVILMHDTADKDTTVKALPGIIEKLNMQDVTLLPITEHTRPVQHMKADSIG